MAGQPGFFGPADPNVALSAAGNPFARFAAVVDFETFRCRLSVPCTERGAGQEWATSV